MGAVFTIGHSTGDLTALVDHLKTHGIDMLVDVRARPHNSFLPQFNRDRIKMVLLQAGIVYAFLGDQLGRGEGGAYSARDQVDFVLEERSPAFLQGLDWLIRESGNHRLCLLCGEENPLHCHRDFLIGQNLQKRGVEVNHILGDGSLQPIQPDLFHCPPKGD